MKRQAAAWFDRLEDLAHPKAVREQQHALEQAIAVQVLDRARKARAKLQAALDLVMAVEGEAEEILMGQESSARRIRNMSKNAAEARRLAGHAARTELENLARVAADGSWRVRIDPEDVRASLASSVAEVRQVEERLRFTRPDLGFHRRAPLIPGAFVPYWCCEQDRTHPLARTAIVPSEAQKATREASTAEAHVARLERTTHAYRNEYAERLPRRAEANDGGVAGAL